MHVTDTHVTLDAKRTSHPLSDTHLNAHDIDHVVIDVTYIDDLNQLIQKSLNRVSEMYPRELRNEEMVMNSSEVVVKLLEKIV